MNSHQIFTGNANVPLAKKIANHLDIELGKSTLKSFSDGEIGCEVWEHVGGEEVYVIQPTCAPTNDNIMELLILGDALKRSGVSKLTAVIPYYGYARQDRRPGFARTPITSKLVADMISAAGFDRVITVDIHSEQQQGFFPKPVQVVNVSGSPELLSDIWRKFGEEIPAGELMVVSPDVGGVARARHIAKRLDNVELAIVDKRREKANESEVMNLIGNVEGKHCIVVDDMVDTAGTLCKAATALKVHGAKSVTAYATHAVLSGAAYDNIYPSDLDELVVLDTIPIPTSTDAGARKCVADGRIRILSIAQLLAETIRRIGAHQSVSAMYTSK